jgi:hypothetical protein
VIISRVGNFWRMVTEDKKDGTVERVFVPSVIIKFLLHYLKDKRKDE